MADTYGQGDPSQDPYAGGTSDGFTASDEQNLRLLLNESSISPYYDDYDELKQFVKILFHPGRAVQARELTQIQTILQDQINRFGGHIFKDGSSLTSGGIGTIQCQFIRVENIEGGNIEDFIGHNVSIVGSTEDTSPVAKVLYVLGPGSSSDPYSVLFIEYVGGDDIFASETLKSSNPSFSSLICDVREIGTQEEDVDGIFTFGQATLITVAEGIYFLGGYFILTEKQTIPLYALSVEHQTEETLQTGLDLIDAPADIRLFSNPTAKVGLRINSSIVTSSDDETLKDPANGFYNYNAPGADRLKVKPTLIQIPYVYTAEYDTSISIYGEVTSDFIEIIRLENGVTVWQRKHPIYNDLGHTLARRTYDESGSYTIRPFELTIKQHLKDDSYKVYCDTGLVTTDTSTDVSFTSNVKIGDVLSGSLSGGKATVYNVEPYNFTGDVDDNPYPNSDTIVTIKMQYLDSDWGEVIGGGHRLFEEDDLAVEGSTDGVIITTIDAIVFVSDSSGAFTYAEGGDDSLLAGQIGPGKSYVYGYEHELLSTRSLPIIKGRDTDSVIDYNVVTNIGNYVNVTFPEGTTKFGNWDPVTFDLNEHPVMNLVDRQLISIEFPFQEEAHAQAECIFWAPLKATEHNAIYDSILFVGADPDVVGSVPCNDGSGGCFGNVYNSSVTGQTTAASYKVRLMSDSYLEIGVKKIIIHDLYNEGVNYTTVQQLVEEEGMSELLAQFDPRVKVYQMDNGIVDGNRGGVIAQGIALRWVPASATGQRHGSVLFVKEMHGEFQYQEDTGDTEIGLENTGGVIFQRTPGPLTSYGSSIKEVQEVPFVQQVTSENNYSDTEIGTYEVGDRVRQARTIQGNSTVFYATGEVVGVGQVADSTECDKIRVWIDVDGDMANAADKFYPSMAGYYDNTAFSFVGNLVKVDNNGEECIPYEIAEEIVMGEEGTGPVQKIIFRESYLGNSEYQFNEEVYQYNPYHAGEHIIAYGDDVDESQRDIKGTVISWNVTSEWPNIYVMVNQNTFRREYGAVFQQPYGALTGSDPSLARMGWAGFTSFSDKKTGFFINLKETYGGNGDIADYRESEILSQFKVDVNSGNYIEGKDYIVGAFIAQEQGDVDAFGHVVAWDHRDPNDATDTRSSILTVRMIEGSPPFVIGSDQEAIGRIIDTTIPVPEPAGNENGYSVSNAYYVYKVLGTARLRQFNAKDEDENWAHFYDIKMKTWIDSINAVHYYEFRNVDSFFESKTETDRIVPAGKVLVFRGHPIDGFTDDGRLKINGTINRAIFPLPIGDVAKSIAKADYRIQKSYPVIFPPSSNSVSIVTGSKNVRFVGGNAGSDVVHGMNLEHYMLITDDGTIIDLSSSHITLTANNDAPSQDGRLDIVGDASSGLSGVVGTLIATLDVNPETQDGEAILSDYRKKTHTSGSSIINIEKNYDTGQWEAKIPQSDITQLLSVKDTNGKTITTWFEFEDGTTDNLYDWATLILKPVYIENNEPTVSKDGNAWPLTVSYNYFSHSGYGPLFVNSYTHDNSNIDFDDIPVYISKQTGNFYPLNTCIDCRPIRHSDGTIKFSWLPKAGEAFDINYSYYLGRHDKLIITSTGDFNIVQGISSLYPVGPDTSDFQVMELYVIKIPPYTYKPEDVKLKYIENKRYTMKDIGVIDRRISALEYYTSLSLLEKETEDLFIDDGSGLNRFKTGTLVDNYTGHSVGDVRNADYNCSIDRQNSHLRCKFDSYNLDFEVDTTSSNTLVKTNDNLYHIPFTHQVFHWQPLVSTKFNINPYDIIDWQGKLTLYPANDNWVDTKKGAVVRVNMTGENDNWDAMGAQATGTDWNDWETNWTGTRSNDVTTTNSIPNTKNPALGSQFIGGTSTIAAIPRTTATTSQKQSRTGVRTLLVPDRITKSLGNRVVDISIAKYIRSRPITIKAEGMKPNATVWPYFDEIMVAEWCTHNGAAIAKQGVVTDDNGSITNLVFTIPEGQFLTGERLFKLMDNDNNQEQLVTTSAEDDFQAQGLVQTKSPVSITTRTFRIVKTNVREKRRTVNTSSEISSVQTTPGTPPVRPGRWGVGGPITGGGLGWPGKTGNFAGGVVVRPVWPGGNPVSRPRPGGRPCPRPSQEVTGYRIGAGDMCRPVFRPVSRRRRPSEVGRHRRSGRPIRQRDPLAQTFFVSAEEHPDGIYLTKIDFWFANKGDVPVSLQIRPVVNGYPHASVVLPFGEELKNAEDVIASTDIPNIGESTSATTFTFQTPVHLVSGQEYAMVLIANSDKYEMYGSTMGQTDLNSGDIISKQPTLGSMFKSQNSTTWEADQNSDMMYIIYHAEFDTTTSYHTTFTEDKDIEEYDGTVVYDLFNMSVNVVEHATAAIQWSIAKTPNVQDGQITDIYSPFQIGQNIYLDTPSKVVLDDTSSTLRVKTELYTANPDVSPFVDMERFGFIGVHNLIESNTDTDETSGSYNGELDPEAFLSPSASLVSSRARYISRMIVLSEEFESSNIHVLFNVNKPAGTEVQVFLKHQRSSDDRSFDKSTWVQLKQNTEDFTSPDSISMTEISYNLEEDLSEPFIKYAIKICLYSNNSASIPKVKDLRAIALL